MEGLCPNYTRCASLVASFEAAESATTVMLAEAMPATPADIPHPDDELSNAIGSLETEMVAATAPHGPIANALLGFLATQAPKSARCPTCPLNELENHLQIQTD